MEYVGCPAHRKDIPATACATCEHQSTVVGCAHLKRSVPVEFCARICPLQRGPRGIPDFRSGKDTILGKVQDPIHNLANALCGAPWVLEKWGEPRPIFANADKPAIEDPRSNVARGCTFPRQIKAHEIRTTVPSGLEV